MTQTVTTEAKIEVIKKTKEFPEVTEAIGELIAMYGDAPWLKDAYQVVDDAGPRLQIEVIDSLYTEDVLLRKIKDCFVCVIKVKA